MVQGTDQLYMVKGTDWQYMVKGTEQLYMVKGTDQRYMVKGTDWLYMVEAKNQQFILIDSKNETRDLLVGITSNFANLISNVDIIGFCKKKSKNRLLTVTVTSLLTQK